MPEFTGKIPLKVFLFTNFWKNVRRAKRKSYFFSSITSTLFACIFFIFFLSSVAQKKCISYGNIYVKKKHFAECENIFLIVHTYNQIVCFLLTSSTLLFSMRKVWEERDEIVKNWKWKIIKMIARSRTTIVPLRFWRRDIFFSLGSTCSLLCAWIDSSFIASIKFFVWSQIHFVRCGLNRKFFFSGQANHIDRINVRANFILCIHKKKIKFLVEKLFNFFLFLEIIVEIKMNEAKSLMSSFVVLVVLLFLLYLLYAGLLNK